MHIRRKGRTEPRFRLVATSRNGHHGYDAYDTRTGARVAFGATMIAALASAAVATA